MTEVVEEKIASPNIRNALESAKEDLENANFPYLLNPLRDGILVPTTEKAIEIVPDIVAKVPLPFLDDIIAFALNVPATVTKVGYSLFPHTNIDDVANSDISKELSTASEKSLLKTLSLCKPKYEPNPILSLVSSGLGFFANSVVDVVTLPFNGKWKDWKDATIKLLAYLTYSGVGKELLAGFASPLTVFYLMIIARVQEEANYLGEANTRRKRTAMTSLPTNVDDKVFRSIMVDAARFVRYASAAYGISMIESAKRQQVYNQKFERASMFEKADEKARKDKMGKYTNSTVLHLTKPGGSTQILGHFIAKDKRKTSLLKDTGEKGNIVLAIRGTYSISGLGVDGSGYTRPFCGGFSHAGIANLTEKLWETVKDDIKDALTKNPGYNLVICGHSLGAGAAALLTLKLIYEGALAQLNSDLEGVKVTCFAFAPPPVFVSKNSTNERINEAMTHIYPFVHENDCVPFLSADSIRHLSATTKAVNNYERGIPFKLPGFMSALLNASLKPSDVGLMAMGVMPIPKELKEIILTKPQLSQIPDADKVGIPAPFVMWMRKVADAGLPEFNLTFCRSQTCGKEQGLNDLLILLDVPNMILDHMNPGYEQSINSVLRQMNSKNKGKGYILE